MKKLKTTTGFNTLKILTEVIVMRHIRPEGAEEYDINDFGVKHTKEELEEIYKSLLPFIENMIKYKTDEEVKEMKEHGCLSFMKIFEK